MPFADVKRVIYKNNPLINVICQLRFPRILSINESLPAGFQDAIRVDYPLFNKSVEQEQHYAIDAAEDDTLSMPRLLQSERMNNYRFSSSDGIWHVNLTSTFISLSTSRYERWEDFLRRFKEPLDALFSIYKPSFFERVGLRYVDAFKRSVLGLEGSDWSELVQPHALGFLSNPQIRNDVRNHNYMAELDVGDGAMAQIKTAMGNIGSIENGQPVFDSELSFIVDSDLYFLRKEISELSNSLDYLHNVSTKLIRSLITEKLHQAMSPQEI